MNEMSVLPGYGAMLPGDRPSTQGFGDRPSTTSSLHLGSSFELPKLKGVDKTSWALRQDALNHHRKWLPGYAPHGFGPSPDRLLQLADELWRLGEEQKHARDQEPWCPDARVRDVRERLLQIAEELNDKSGPAAAGAGRRELEAPEPWPPKVPAQQTDPADDAPESTRNETAEELERLRRELAEAAERNACLGRELVELQASATGEENIRLRHELKERTKRMEAMEQAYLAFVAEKANAKGRHMKASATGIKSRLLFHDTVLALQVCLAWSNATAEARHGRVAEAARQRGKKLASAVRARTVDHGERRQDSALLSVCLTSWGMDLLKAKFQSGLDEANGRCGVVRKRLAPTINHWFEGNGQACFRDLFISWVGVLREARLERNVELALKGGTGEMEKAMEKLLAEKRELVERFSGKAMEAMRRRINAGAESVLHLALSAWQRALDESRKMRELEVEREKAMAIAREARAKAVALALGRTSTALQQQVLQGWAGALAAVRAERARKDQAMVKGLRAIASSDDALKSLCFQTWQKEVGIARLEAAERLMKEAKAKSKEEKLETAQKMLARIVAGSMNAAFGSWHGIVEAAKLEREKKDQSMKLAARMINNSANALLQECMTPWAEFARKTSVRNRMKGKNMTGALKKLAEANAAFMAQCLSLWSRFTIEEKRQREYDELDRKAKAASEKARQQKMEAVERCFGQGLQALMSTVLTAWVTLLDAKRLQDQLKDKGMAGALRKIMDAARALLGECIRSWSEDCKQEKQQREMDKVQAMVDRVAAARLRALTMYEKSLHQKDQDLLSTFVQAWRQEIEAAKSRERRKDQIMAKVMRGIADGEGTLLTMSMTGWAKAVKESGEEAKSLARRRRALVTCRAVVVRLRDRILMRTAWDGWLFRAM